MKSMPKIEKVMTTMPHTIGKTISIAVAMEFMREHRIRHLPVLDEARLVGVLTDRDIKLARSFNDASKMLVEDVMTPEPYTVSPHAAVDEVAAEMAEHKYGCAIVRQENGKVVGIFTSVDGLSFLSHTLREHHKKMD